MRGLALVLYRLTLASTFRGHARIRAQQKARMVVQGEKGTKSGGKEKERNPLITIVKPSLSPSLSPQLPPPRCFSTFLT